MQVADVEPSCCLKSCHSARLAEEGQLAHVGATWTALSNSKIFVLISGSGVVVTISLDGPNQTKILLILAVKIPS